MWDGQSCWLIPEEHEEKPLPGRVAHPCPGIPHCPQTPQSEENKESTAAPRGALGSAPGAPELPAGIPRAVYKQGSAHRGCRLALLQLLLGINT